MKGILFKPDMIEAIVESRKTQTRRVLKLQPPPYCDSIELLETGTYNFYQKADPDFHAYLKSKPRYQVDEVVYIKEAIHRFNLEYASYDLDYTPVMFLQSANRFHWRWEKDYLSPLHLPYDAARYFIKITDVRVERLQEVTLEDVYDEGIDIMPSYDRIDAFKKLWDSINKSPYDWQSNPWVWVYSFKFSPRTIMEGGRSREMKLTKSEIRDIQAYDNSFNPSDILSSEQARGHEIRHLIIIVHGRKELHDSGYPLIKIIGREYESSQLPSIKYYDLGWHDHFLCNIRVNIDSYGKNVLRVMPWMSNKPFRVSPYFIPVSTFEIGCNYPDAQPENTLS